MISKFSLYGFATVGIIYVAVFLVSKNRAKKGIGKS
jgi:hypothetical protein